MEPDTRELILDRLAAVVAALPGVGKTSRNDTVTFEEGLPSVMMLDGDESASDEPVGKGRPAYGPNTVSLAPELYVISEADAETVGEVITSTTDALISAVLNDATLLGLCQDGDIRFEGMTTSFTVASRKVLGEASVNIVFHYSLVPDDSEAVSTPATEDLLPREAILSAIFQCLNQVGATTVQRNDLVVYEEGLPTIILLDGDEEADERVYGRGRPASSPNRVTMRPEIYIVAETSSDAAGSVLNDCRFKVLSALLRDPYLASLAADGVLRYDGCQTGFALGRSMAAEMGIDFSVTYLRRFPDA